MTQNASPGWPFSRLCLNRLWSLDRRHLLLLEGAFELLAVQEGFKLRRPPRCLNRTARLFDFPAPADGLLCADHRPQDARELCSWPFTRLDLDRVRQLALADLVRLEDRWIVSARESFGIDVATSLPADAQRVVSRKVDEALVEVLALGAADCEARKQRTRRRGRAAAADMDDKGSRLARAEAKLAAAGSHDAASSTEACKSLAAILAEIERASIELDADRHAVLVSVLQGVVRRLRQTQGAPWSVDPTKGRADRWPSALAHHMPRWKARAATVGVSHTEQWGCDVFYGTRDALIATGIVGAGDFPGDVGRGRTMVTFGRDGTAKRKGEASRPAALRVAKSGRSRFLVEVHLPDDVCNERRAERGLLVFDRFGHLVESSEQEAQQARGGPLRLVYSRDGCPA